MPIQMPFTLKVTSINPGGCLYTVENTRGYWYFYIVVNGSNKTDNGMFDSANNCKNYMLKEVNRLRSIYELG